MRRPRGVDDHVPVPTGGVAGRFRSRPPDQSEENPLGVRGWNGWWGDNLRSCRTSCERWLSPCCPLHSSREIEHGRCAVRLSGLWVALMLTYLLGDVLRIFSGDFKAGEIGGVKVTQAMWLGIAILMVIPIVMVFLSLTLKNPTNRWANIIVAIIFFAFNLIGLPTYPSVYDKFLIVVGLGFNVVTVWYAWRWV